MTLVYPLDHRYDLPLEEITALVGGKAANLGVMVRELGLPVPPGMAITTAACRAYLADGWPAGLDAELRAGMVEVERTVGRRFGDPADPLLLSVRSGAPVSMPGMMDTILNLGLNDENEAGLTAASDDPDFGRDCHRRFRAMFREIVAPDVPDDPWVQLRLAIEAVFRSWNSDRARAYRQRDGIPDEIGTGVTVQAMVFGNRGQDSGTGVVFTRNPATGEPGLYGDVMFAAQGEDVVAGNHATLPITVLDARLPSAARELRDDAGRLEVYYRDLCDIEFTIEQGRLWLLQVRVGKRSPQAALRIAVAMASDDAFPLSREEALARVAHLLSNPPRMPAARGIEVEPLVHGLPASPGLATGEIVTNPDDAQRMAEDGRAAILVRAETSPDDVHGMARSVGILTASGGLASHAAVVARGWGIPAVVGAREVEVREGEVRFPGLTLRAGDVITVDGDSGAVYRGSISAPSEVVPEVRTLRAWADELGIDIGPGPDRGGPAVKRAAVEPAIVEPAGDATEAIDADECILAIGIKGVAAADAAALALRSTPPDVQPVLDGLVDDGLASLVSGAYRLTEAGKARRARLLATEQASIGAEPAVAALDAFLALDSRVKATVTEWQLRPTDGEPVLNDHTDPDYDRATLARLAGLHAETAAWIRPLEGSWPRARGYRVRLDGAIERALDGDQRYVASPRVDSYHGIWFELHEELILLAGRTRADEVVAGRA
jgi:pyruvate,orthophosphate dikinase